MKMITLIDKTFILKKNALFANLDLDILLTIADKMNLLRHKPDDLIFPLNQEAHKMYFIVDGTVLIEDKNKKMITHLESGDFFGEESLFNEKVRGYSAVSVTNTTLLTLSATHLLSIISECPTVATQLLEACFENIDFRPRSSTP